MRGPIQTQSGVRQLAAGLCVGVSFHGAFVWQNVVNLTPADQEGGGNGPKISLPTTVTLQQHNYIRHIETTEQDQIQWMQVKQY